MEETQNNNSQKTTKITKASLDETIQEILQQCTQHEENTKESQTMLQQCTQPEENTENNQTESEPQIKPNEEFLKSEFEPLYFCIEKMSFDCQKSIHHQVILIFFFC